MKKVSLLLALFLTSIVAWSQTIDYQQRFKDAVAQLDSCQECAVRQLLEIKAAQYAPETVRINSTIVLANISVSIGNIESLDVFLKDIEQYIAQHPDDKNVSSTLERLKGYRSELEKQQESFRDRLVGTWVTAETNTEHHFGGHIKKLDGVPHYILEILCNENNNFSAILFSSWSNKISKPYETNNIDIVGSNKAIAIHFGTERMEKANTEYAQALMNQVRQNASESAATKARTGYSDWSKDFSNIFLTVMAKDAATGKTNSILKDFFLQELTPDILYGRLFYERISEQSNWSDAKTYQSTRDVYFYRIVPEDNIVFGCSKSFGYWLTRLNNHFKNFDDLKKTKLKKEKIDQKEYNRREYIKLQAKIMKHLPGLDRKHAEWVKAELEYGPQGYSWNDGYYVASEADAIHNRYSYDENLKGPYYRGNRAYWTETIHDYWKGFDRKDNFGEYFDFTKDFNGSGVPKYFKMKNDIDNKKNKEEEEDEE